MSRFPSHGRAERLIAGGRVALAALSLLACHLDPSEPATYARTAYLLLSTYVGYSLVLFAVLRVFQTLPGWWPIATHVVDLGAFSVFMYFTNGSNSPFVVYFTFSLACATLRWQWRGAVWTGVAATAAFLAIGFYGSRVLRNPTFHLNDFIVRGSHLVVLAALLSYLGAYQERLSAEKSRLAGWPRREAGQLQTLVRDLLEHAAAVLESPRMMMVWEDPEEAWTHVACRSDGKFELNDEPLAVFGSLVVKPLAGTSFLCLTAGSESARVLINSPGGMREWKGAPLDPGLQARFNIRSVLSWSLEGEAIEGRLFALGKPETTPDDLVLGEIVAGLVVARMNHFALGERLLKAAATEERIRLSRDLHDGLLQSLTGVALQLQVSRRLLERDPQAAKERLREIQISIADEQRDLRSLVGQLKPAPAGGSVGSDLRLRLEEICNRIERQWGLRVKLASDGLRDRLPDPLAEGISRIVHEALVNAARHAEASVVDVDVVRNDGGVHIVVADNGCGFSFQGTYDLVTLGEMKAGPITLNERIAALGGDLVICSTESGARLDISLPVPKAGS